MRHRPHEDKKAAIENQSKFLQRRRQGSQRGRTLPQSSPRETPLTQNTLLFTLPTELLCEIAKYLQSNDHNALCQTCKHLYQGLTPQLYQRGGAGLAKAIQEKKGVHPFAAWIRAGATKGTVLCGVTALTHAALCSDMKIIDMVLATDGDIESIVESNGRTPLSYALLGSNTAVIMIMSYTNYLTCQTFPYCLELRLSFRSTDQAHCQTQKEVLCSYI